MAITISGTTGIAGVDGSAGTPAVQGTDTNTGVFYPAADTVGVSTGGSERMRIDSSGNVGIGTSAPNYKLDVQNGTARIYNSTYPSLRIHNSTTGTASNDGLLLEMAGADANFVNYEVGNMIFKTTDTERMRIDSSGNVGVNTTTTTRARLNIDTDGTNTSAGYGLALTNTAGGGATWTLQCGDQAINNGAFTIRQTGISGTTWFKIEATTGYITVQGVYNLTTASAANVFVGTGGDLRRSTSSLKYKTDVQDATYGLAEVMVLRPVTYKGKNDGDTVFGGLIAEEVEAAGLTEFVQYAEDGSPDALAYGNMVSLCIKAIQEQQALITALTARIEALEAK